MPQNAAVRACDPAEIDAVLFDLDGVITDTAALHARAWKRTFDDFLDGRAGRWRPFDIEQDYRTYVDGKPRPDGVASFLESRGICLPLGHDTDPPDRETVWGLGNSKNERYTELLATEGVPLYGGSVDLVRRLKAAGVRVGVVSSSRNCRSVIEAAGIADLFEVRVDGLVARDLNLAGKPAPDLFLEAARQLGVPPGRAAVVEDAEAGVRAGRAGDFALVVGVDRAGRPDDLRACGADVVVPDLSAIAANQLGPEAAPEAPNALYRFAELAGRLHGCQVALFLDYDGTLTPIVDRPELAVLDPAMRSTLSSLSHLTRVTAVISGRARGDIQSKVDLPSLIYAGSHGFDIVGPAGLEMEHEAARAAVPQVAEAARRLEEELGDLPGVIVENKTYGLALHYRLVAAADVPRVLAVFDEVTADLQGLRKTTGKKIVELRPKIEWDKGSAVLWLLERLDCGPDTVPIYIGDDVTDFDAFRVLRNRGIGIFVGKEEDAGGAQYRLTDPAEVEVFFSRLARRLWGDGQ